MKKNAFLWEKILKIIIYASVYGSAKKYAEELSRITGIKAKSFKELKSLSDFETIIYIGALYAGGVLGLKKTFQKEFNLNGKKIIIATVGLSDPENNENISNIQKSLKLQLSNDVLNCAKIFHLRGGIDYSKLKVVHKTTMHLLYKKALSLPPEKQNAETKAMIETYNKKVDFVDFDSLKAIVSEVL